MYFFRELCSHLKNHGIALIYTDTIPGFVGDAFSAIARKKIYSLKKRTIQKKLACAFASIKQIEKIAELNQTEKKILKKYFPGELTIILKVKKNHQLLFGKTIAARIPNCPFLLKLLSFYNNPFVLTSSNFSGQKEFTNIVKIKKQFSVNNFFKTQFSKNKINFFLLDKKLILKPMASSIIQVVDNEIKFLRYGRIKEIEV